MKATGTRWIQKGVGSVFLIAGTGKLLLPVAGGAVPTFATVLAAMQMPHPDALALSICLTEITAGTALLLDRKIRLASCALGCVLIGALATFSIPSTFGAPLVVQGWELGREPFRIPLEAGLLLALIGINRNRRVQGGV